MFLKIILLLLIEFVAGNVIDPIDRCKRTGLLCKEDWECCTGECFSIGNIGFSSCVIMPGGSNIKLNPTKIENQRQCIKEGGKCYHHNDCCFQLCINRRFSHQSGVCKYPQI